MIYSANLIHEQSKLFYLEWFNDTESTLDDIASRYGIDKTLARSLIKHGSFIHELEVAKSTRLKLEKETE